MTAPPSWDTGEESTTDADLVRGSLAGDRAAFAQIYDRYADRLYDFCIGMLRDRDGAADCVQDIFCLAATRMGQLRDPDRLRPWLYAIARSEALRRLRDRRRERPSDELPDRASDDVDPETLAARTELADLVAEAAGGLSDRDRAVFDLAFRHGLGGPDLAEALGVSHSNANTLVQRLKRTVERSLGALLIARRARSASGGCPELREMLANWDGQFTVLMRKRIARHIESCRECDGERRRLVSPAALLGAAPVFIPAPKWLREQTLSDVELTSHGSALQARSDGDSARAGAGVGRNRARSLSVLALLVTLGATGGLALLWLNHHQVSVTPAEVSKTAPTPAQSTPAVLPPRPPSMQAPKPVPPTSAAPPKTSVVLPPPPTVVAPPTTPPDAGPPAPDSDPDFSLPPQDSPSRAPMSFSPTVVVPPGPVLESGDRDSDSGRDPAAPNNPGPAPG